MKKFIRANREKLVTSFFVALGITILFVILKNMGMIGIECKVQYLNPWQHYLQCSLFYGAHYFIVFIFGFFVTFYMMKKP